MLRVAAMHQRSLHTLLAVRLVSAILSLMNTFVARASKVTPCENNDECPQRSRGRDQCGCAWTDGECWVPQNLWL